MRRRFAMEQTFARPKHGRRQPRAGIALKAGKIPAIVTQNIDNLHQTGFCRRACDRTPRVITLTPDAIGLRSILGPGVGSRKRCCDQLCAGLPACGRAGEDGTISFAQAMPEDAMQRATELASIAKLFLAIGSSRWSGRGRLSLDGQKLRGQARESSITSRLSRDDSAGPW